MNEIVKEWVDKAEGDFGTANRELATDEPPNFDAVCFHAQQCVEKLMKAVLIQHQVEAPYTRDLVQLNTLLIGVYPTWECDNEALRFLTQASVAFR